MRCRPNLPRLASRIFGTPLAIQPDKLDAILAAVGPRLFGGDVVFDVDPEALPRRPYEVDGSGVAVLPIDGSLVQRASYLDAASGLMGYDFLAGAVTAAAADPAVRAILLDFASAGGEVAGIEDCCSAIIKARSSKPIWAIADEMALSAAYWLASATNQVWCTGLGWVGSIGVMTLHLDKSAAEQGQGLKYTAVFSGKRKNDGTPHEPLSEEARAFLQRSVDAARMTFAQAVSRHRPRLSVEAVLATEAALYRGQEAVQLGLADRVGTFAECLEVLGAAAGGRSAARRGQAAQRAEAPIEVLQAAHLAPPARLRLADTIHDDDDEELPMSRTAEIAQLCEFAKCPERAAEFVFSEMTAEQVRSMLLAERAAETEANPISTARPAGPAAAAGDAHGWDQIARKVAAHRWGGKAA